MVIIKRSPSRNHSRTEVLAEIIYKRKRNGFINFPVILGAGASISSGASSMRNLVTSIAGKYNLRKFYAILDQLDDSSRVALLWEHLSTTTPSSGYGALVWLLKKGYFNLIFTTNHDTLLENSLSKSGLLYGQDYAVTIMGRDTEDAIIESLSGIGPRIKIIKLHGCISIRKCAFTPVEILEFQPKVENIMSEHLTHGAIIVGHGMRDMDLDKCFTKKTGTVWYVGPKRPKVGEPISNILGSIRSNMILGYSGMFDNFFNNLRDQIAALESTI